MSEFSGLGFGVGVVRGARSFNVTPDGRLTGVFHQREWVAGENVASCMSLSSSTDALIAAIRGLTRSSYGLPAIPFSGEVGPTPKSHDMSKCTCGFYAYYDGSNDYATDARVSAVVEGYGQTVIGTRGFRAGKARIVALHLEASEPPKPWKWWLHPHRWAVEKLVDRSLRTNSFSNSWIVSIGMITAFIGIGIWLLVIDWKAFEIYLFERYRSVSKNPSKWYRPRDNGRGLTPEQVDGIRRGFPDVPLFSSFEEMVRAFPPDESLGALPDRWARS
ncbi:hypothetical protein SCB71_06485 [Herbiconiux sp. KACC 21604]|uniref:hypothetical protein n=1 Tax=unclassified Herbiconiux TaxID=2618217 RepID=UPI0014926615|nr:hypothetical protein [Herbiconiux sp. SALV-R1]QJU52962.1 hypothetical protein HL652_04470 [Herbiconiux sp. SALV-R1]WPO87886.1 hypothetical protein SCB71_06485 [Herbiconiux sp. KACC 21604]